MENWINTLNKFVVQAHTNDLRTSSYPKEWDGLKLRVSFGMGAPARVPWIAFLTPDIAVSKGYYPVYLYYKEFRTLILSYGISETEEFGKTWPAEIINTAQTIKAYFNTEIPRYGDSFVFKAYKVDVLENHITYLNSDSNEKLTQKVIEADLDTINDYYKRLFTENSSAIEPQISQGLFYMEKQLEDFIVHNWDKTKLSEKYNLIIEDGELISQQYRTDIGPIDILAKDKGKDNYVVIELKKNQTSDDTVGQLTRYMGWIKEVKKDNNVAGIIIAGQSDNRLNYALSTVPNTELFLYEVDFKLSKVE
jgi:hypothetical protein